MFVGLSKEAKGRAVFYQLIGCSFQGLAIWCLSRYNINILPLHFHAAKELPYCNVGSVTTVLKILPDEESCGE
jgi:hypothetical protein